MVTTAGLLGTVHLGVAVAGQCWGRNLRGRGCVQLGFRKASSAQGLLSSDGGGKADFVWLMGCSSGSVKKGLKLEAKSVRGGVDLWEATAAATARPEQYPEHLVVMVNGLVGSADNWKYAAEQFVQKLPDKVIVHRSQCNYLTLTFDGVDLMGERLAEEVLSVAHQRPGVQKISFVAHSLGGLVARYAIGRLYEPGSLTESSVAWRCLTTGRNSEGRVAGLEPVNFITVATPHLGSRGHKQLPFLCGLPFLERSASHTAHLVVGRTGKHLFLTDNDDGKPPLLLRMVDDCYGLKFRSALCSFRRRVAYANANFDHMVGWRTSSIRRQHELPNSHLRVSDEKYPHIVYIDRDDTLSINKEAPSAVRVQTVDLEEEMIRGLTQVPWERVDVSFKKSTQRYVAHSTIQVKSYWINSDGADVIYHMIDNFLI
uniref:Putative lipase YOR059C n=1 Tax=Anthurium amnicola TaxID=1678845 RepID=A0A1D1Z3C5_9ARAE